MNKPTASKTSRRIFPIKFERLIPGSTYQIFAEPSRGIRKSNDKTIYRKECEAYSVDTGDEARAIILMPEDLVTPLSRGK